MLQKLFNKPRSFTYRLAICCIVKDEEKRYLEEFIDYHSKAGVEHFYFYDNESSWPLAEALKDYVRQGIVTITVVAGKGIQTEVYGRCLKQYGPICQWIAFIDVDEYIVVKTLNGNIPDFLKNYEQYGALCINWLLFGSNGQNEKSSESQLSTYIRRSLKSLSFNEHVKSIVQAQYAIDAPYNPHHFRLKKGWYTVNENFERVDGPLSTHTSNKIQLNHYFLRSLEDYNEKMKRGRADSPTTDRTIDYFYELNKEANLIVDESVLELELMWKAAESNTSSTNKAKH
ncbi:glycosyltransferase family 92 protein [Mucilaginibacter koreensis]